MRGSSEDAVYYHGRHARWHSDGVPQAGTKTTVASAISLSLFLFALESDRLPVLTPVIGREGVPIPSVVIPTLILGMAVVFVARRPSVRVPGVLPYLAAALCSVGLAGRYLPASPRSLGLAFDACMTVYSFATPALLYFWARAAMPYGRAFTTQSFGVAAIIMGALTLLTIALDRTVAAIIVTLLPVAGAVVLGMVVHDPAYPEPRATDRSYVGWSALGSIASARPIPFIGNAHGPGLWPSIARVCAKLLPFACYSVIFGNVHFSWVAIQGEGTISGWVQAGAATGAILCGMLALMLAHMRWGNALEMILELLLIAMSLVALWLSAFLTSSYVFAYLVLLNIAQKLTLLLVVLFGFRLSNSAMQSAALLAVAYFSFYLGTAISFFVNVLAGASLNGTSAIALAVAFVSVIIEMTMIYGSVPLAVEEKKRANGAASGRMDQNTTSPHGSLAGGLADRAVSAQSDATRTDVPPVFGEALGAAPATGTRARPAESPQFADIPAGITGVGGGEGSSQDRLSYGCYLVSEAYDLTRRESEILLLLMRGRSASKIADALCISVSTARTHQRNIYAKLGVHSQQEILDMAERYRGSANEDTSTS